MKITMRDRLGKTIEEMLSPDDTIVLRCTGCQEFFLPRELHTLSRRVNIAGTWTFETAELCPACYPQPNLLTKEERVEPSSFVILTRDQFETTRAYERAGLVPPQNVLIT